jgi:acylglycerol kinase
LDQALAQHLEPSDFEALDAVVIAGGDGSLSEAVTGFLLRSDAMQPAPIVPLPLGRQNYFVSNLFSSAHQPTETGGAADVARIAKLAMAALNGSVRQVDVMKVEDSRQGSAVHPVYLLNHLRLGPFMDVEEEAKTLWWWGPLRRPWAYLKAVVRGRLDPVRVKVLFRDPCPGCQACLEIGKKKKRTQQSEVVHGPSAGRRCVA